ncbi:hypothetical protein PUMCH_003934 [Australozyma saopauloensis]|uniref:Uncharacterized protein n=1 Tax=Australozyma saopauloensis TaxID=291208 RepID=A0AAX4HDN7_9ASCO|nr:hypothetical protein PUMCH_003934 [[Candida] saopauloensis]
MMIYDDVRRCRRCKRRRMDDEPPEVQQYKTCAKCRIIERTKKKSRKPLAEETMRYGMRQFQEQNQSTEFMGDDMFANDPYNDIDTPGDSVVGSPQQPYHSKTGDILPHQDGHVGTNGNGYGYDSLPPPPPPHSTTSASAMRPATVISKPASIAPSGPQNTAASTASTAIGGLKNRGADFLNRPKPVLRQYRDPYKQFLRLQTPDRSRLPQVSNCEICSALVNPDVPLSAIYRLCDACYADPYSQPLVFDDFNTFLLKAVADREYLSYKYVAEIPKETVESLLNGRHIGSEDQFRKALMESFALIYMDPVLALLAPLKFTRLVQNVGEMNSIRPVVLQYSQQLHYPFTLPLRLAYGVNTDSEKTRVDMLFVPETNIIIIKKKTQAIAPTYSSSFLRNLDEQWKNSGLGFDASPLDVFSALKITISRDQFVRDFHGLVKQIKALRVAENGVHNKHPVANTVVRSEELVI